MTVAGFIERVRGLGRLGRLQRAQRLGRLQRLRRLRRRTKVLLGTGVALVFCVLVGNYLVGRVLQARIAHVAQARLHGNVTAGISGAPAIADAIRGSVPSVQIDATGAKLCKVGGVDVSANLSQVAKHDAHLSVGSSQATVTIGSGTLTRAVERKLPSATAEPDPSDGTLDVDVGPGGAIGIQLQPKLSGDTISFGVTGVDVLGQPASESVVKRVSDRVHLQRTLGHLPLGTSPTGVKVTSGGVAVELRGGAWQGSVSGGSRVCSA